MKTNLIKKAVLVCIVASSTGVAFAQDYGRHDREQRYNERYTERYNETRRVPEYQTSISNPRRNLIDDFKAYPSDPQMERGTITFELEGEPRGVATVIFTAYGRQDKIVRLTETERGQYSGTYVIRSADDLQNKTFNANLRVGKKTYTARFEPSGYNAVVTERTEVIKTRPAFNPNFGTVVAVEQFEGVANNYNGVNAPGALIGAAAGGILGNQVGGGSGRTLATVAGALGGAYVGNNVAHNNNRVIQYRVTVRFEDGAQQVYVYDNPGDLAVNTKVVRAGNRLELR